MPGRTTRGVTSVRDLPSIRWRKSRYSDDQGDNCVEVAVVDDQVLVRDSKDPDGPTLAFTPSEWRAFIDGVKDSEFDLP
jgi:Domain of unknown function (DUF397)